VKAAREAFHDDAWQARQERRDTNGERGGPRDVGRPAM